jgi:hypothetical protein
VKFSIHAAFLPRRLLPYLTSGERLSLLDTHHGKIRLMLKRRQLENFTATRLAGLCRVIAANAAMDKVLAERARLLELEWKTLQVTPSTYAARREHHRKMKELTTKMVELLSTIWTCLARPARQGFLFTAAPGSRCSHVQKSVALTFFRLSGGWLLVLAVGGETPNFRNDNGASRPRRTNAALFQAHINGITELSFKVIRFF